MIRILVTGSREFSDEDIVFEALSEHWERLCEIGRVIVVHGGARGADTLAHQWAGIVRMQGVREEVHPAKWNRQPDGSYNKLAGFERNQAMVDAGADVALAFYVDGAGNRGTADCVRRAKLAGIPVIEYHQPEGH